MVVGSGCGDVLKYTGEGVVLHGIPSTQGVPYHVNYVNYSHFGVFLKTRALDAPCPNHVILFADVMSFNDTVMSYVMSQCRMCIGHMTVYYKRATNTSGRRVSVSLLVC